MEEKITGSCGFCGSRSLSGSDFDLCRSLAGGVVGSGGRVLTGCVSGADRAARLGAGPGCIVFRVRGRVRADFVRRSIRFIESLAAAPRPVLVGFPDRPCPPGLVPSPSPAACFRGLGSGTWASLALAAGMGIPVVVFGLPVDGLPHWGGLFGGAWRLRRSGILAGGFRWCPPF